MSVYFSKLILKAYIESAEDMSQFGVPIARAGMQFNSTSFRGYGPGTLAIVLAHIDPNEPEDENLDLEIWQIGGLDYFTHTKCGTCDFNSIGAVYEAVNGPGRWWAGFAMEWRKPLSLLLKLFGV